MKCTGLALPSTVKSGARELLKMNWRWYPALEKLLQTCCWRHSNQLKIYNMHLLRTWYPLLATLKHSLLMIISKKRGQDRYPAPFLKSNILWKTEVKILYQVHTAIPKYGYFYQFQDSYFTDNYPLCVILQIQNRDCRLTIPIKNIYIIN